MSGLEQEIAKLYERTARTRYQFLKNELQSCRVALDMAEFELSIGNAVIAESEAEVVTKGIATVRRFLALASAEHQLEIGKQAEEIEAALVFLKAKLNPAAR